MNELKKTLEKELYHPIDMAIYEASRYQIPSTAVLLTAPIEALRVMEESMRKNDRVIALDSSHFFLLYAHSPIEKGRIALDNLMKKLQSRGIAPDFYTLVPINNETDSPESVIEQLYENLDKSA